MSIPANRALVPFRPFLIVRVAEFDDEPAEIRTAASREDCERALFDWIEESVVPNEISGGSFNPGGGCYIFTASEYGELRHQRTERPNGGCHFGPWTEQARPAADNDPWPF